MRGGERLQPVEWLTLALAALIAHGFYWRIVSYPSACCDAQRYLDAAEELVRNGLFSKFQGSNFRTYGYPWVLSFLLRLSRRTGVDWGLLIFELQLLLHLASALFVRGAVLRLAPARAALVSAALALNPFVLSYAPETLTESISISLTTFAIGLWMRQLAAEAADGGWRVLVAGGLVVGLAVMIRPANVYLAASWLLATVATALTTRGGRTRAALASLLSVTCLMVPMLPQLANNIRHYGRPTPLVVFSGMSSGHWMGIRNLKYATALPVPGLRVLYENPFAAGTTIDRSRPLAWYGAHPLAGALTLGLHVFNLLDQDLFFTYSRDLDPWYRIPVGVIDHGMVALSLVGAWRLLRRAWRAEDRRLRLAMFALAGFLVCYCAVYAPLAVDMRYGLPLLLLAMPFAAWTAAEAAQRATNAHRAALAGFVVAYIVAALAVSAWVRQQAPAIRDWRASRVVALRLPNTLARTSGPVTP